VSQETMKWLNNNTLIGFTDKRGNAWHYRESDQGDESNHYPGAIPVDDVLRRLFNFKVIESPITYVVSGVVDNAIGPIDVGHILGIVAHLFLSGPAVDIGLGDPKSIRRQCPWNRRVAPSHDAFANRGVTWKSAAGRRHKIIHRLNEKRGAGSRGLSGNDC